MKNPYDEFNDTIIYSDGHCDPVSGSTADFTYDDEEYREYAKILGVMPMGVARW